MNIQTLTSAKNYNSYVSRTADDAGLIKYSSSPPSHFLQGEGGGGGGGGEGGEGIPSPPVKTTSSPSLIQHSQQQVIPQQQTYQQSPYSNNNNDNSDLQSVVSKYHANPELLKLILASKVEEDRRRTEEAKLKAKELDFYFQQNQQLVGVGKEITTTTNRNTLQQQQFQAQQQQQQAEQGLIIRRRSSSSSSTSSNGSTTNINESIQHRRIAPYSIPARSIASVPINNNNNNNRNSSVVSSSLNMNQLNIYNSIPVQQQSQPQPHKIAMASSAPNTSSHYLYPTNLPSQPSSLVRSSSDNNASNLKISRRRRSMQALTKLVETTENPYDDGHFWKNNGNTVQKKTGCKSVYYKCANSCKGCPVNKTVVEQLDGSYLIKYRGDHIVECSQVEHVRDL